MDDTVVRKADVRGQVVGCRLETSPSSDTALPSKLRAGCGHNHVSPSPIAKRCPPCPSQSTGLFSKPFLFAPILDTNFEALPSAWELEVSQAIPGTAPASLLPHIFCSEELAVVKEDPTAKDTAAGNPTAKEPITASTENCSIKLTHPFHTYLIHALCSTCTLSRAQRMAKFETSAIISDLNRDVARKQNRTQPKQQPQRNITISKGGARLQLQTSSKICDVVPTNKTETDKPPAMGALRLKTLGLDKFRESLKNLTSPTIITSTTTPRATGWSSGSGPHTSGTMNVSTERDPALSWLGSPRLRTSLNLSLGMSRARNRAEEELSPEHFAVSTLLYDSQESLATDEASLRSRDVSRNRKSNVDVGAG